MSKLQKDPRSITKVGPAINYGTLGREIKISPKSAVTILPPGFQKEFMVPIVSIGIGIGNDHTAELIMDEEAWEALKNGEEISINTLKQFKKNFL